VKILFSFILISAVCASAELQWEEIETVATNDALAAQWTEFTDFIADVDPVPDDYLYLKLWDGTPIPWQEGDQSAEGSLNIYRVPANADPNDMPDSWEYVLKIPANAQANERLATVKRANAFIMNNFGRYLSAPGTGGAGYGWDWSIFSYFKTNAAGALVLNGPVPEYPVSYHAGNTWPYAFMQICGFMSFESPWNFIGIYSNAGSDENYDLEVRSVSGMSYNRLVGVYTDELANPAARGVIYNNNAYFWKGPSALTTNDGIWCVSNVVGAVSLTNSFEKAFNLIPVSTMAEDADTWDAVGGGWGEDASDPVGIAAIAPSENYLGKDLIVVSFRASGHMYAFDLAQPTAGPITLYDEVNLWPEGQDEYRAQLGKVGSLLFMLDGTTDEDRVLRRLDLIPEPGSVLSITCILLWIGGRTNKKA